MVRIREATWNDLAVIRTMGLHFLETRPFGSPSPGIPERLDAAIDVSLRTGVTLLAAEDTTPAEPFGMLVIYCIEHPFTGELIAEELAWWVEPEYRRGRVGHYLLRAGIEWARQVGVSCLRMNAPAGSRVGAILEHHGFTAVETVHVLRF